MVSFTAANTRRILVVSVAWVRLRKKKLALQNTVCDWVSLLRVQVEVGSVDLVEPPEEIFGGAVDIVASRIIREIVAQRRSAEFLAEQIDLVEEQNDTRAHEPSRIDDRVKKHQALHHTVLF